MGLKPATPMKKEAEVLNNAGTPEHILRSAADCRIPGLGERYGPHTTDNGCKANVSCSRLAQNSHPAYKWLTSLLQSWFQPCYRSASVVAQLSSHP